jgi:hypothetical protein
MFHYCPQCVETRLHPQPFIDTTGRLLCGACWFLDGEEVEMVESDDIFPSDITGCQNDLETAK